MSLILLIAAADRELPDEFYVSEGEAFSLAGFFSAVEEDQALSASRIRRPSTVTTGAENSSA